MEAGLQTVTSSDETKEIEMTKTVEQNKERQGAVQAGSGGTGGTSD